MKNLVSVLIGAIIGSLITVSISYVGIVSDMSLQIKEAQVELGYAEKIIYENLEESSNGVPVYSLLQDQSDWSFVFGDLSDKEFEKMYYELKQLDELREYIIICKSNNNILDNDNNGKDDYIERYYNKLNELNDSGIVQKFNNVIRDRISNAYKVAAY